MLLVGGDSSYLGESSNNFFANRPIVSPPMQSRHDPTTFLSYNLNDCKCVIVKNDGKYLINSTEYIIRDRQGITYKALSAVNTIYGIFFIVSDHNCPEKNKIACINKEDPYPIFVDTGNINPMYLYGDDLVIAVIDSEGGIIFFNIYYHRMIRKMQPKINFKI